MNILQDLKYAARTLKNSPGFLAVALLTLSIAIAANTAIFSVVKTVLLQPFSYAEPERIALIWTDDSRTQNNRGQVSATEVEDIRRQSTTLERITTFADWTPILS